MLYVGPSQRESRERGELAWTSEEESNLTGRVRNRNLVQLFRPVVTGDVTSIYAIGEKNNAIIYGANNEELLEPVEAALYATHLLRIEGNHISLYRRILRAGNTWEQHNNPAHALQNTRFEGELLPASEVVERVIPRALTAKRIIEPKIQTLVAIVDKAMG